MLPLSRIIPFWNDNSRRFFFFVLFIINFILWMPTLFDGIFIFCISFFFERQWLREMRWYTEYILIHSTQFEFWRKTKWKILKFLMHENSHANKNKKKMCHNIIMMVYDNWDNHRHHHHCLIACCMISDSSSYILIHNNVDGKKFLWNFFFWIILLFVSLLKHHSLSFIYTKKRGKF